MGSWLRRNGCIATSRDTREEAELQAIEKLKAGYAVAIMPEGRLVPPTDRPEGVGQGRHRISRIARATGATIVRSLSPEVILCGHLVKGSPFRALSATVIKFALEHLSTFSPMMISIMQMSLCNGSKVFWIQ